MKHLTTFLLLICCSSALASVPNNRHIFVEGEAQISAAPDIAVLYFEVNAKEDASLAAKGDVDKRVNDFLNGLKDFEVDERNVSASNITTEPNYYYTDEDKKVLDGYIASRSVKVTLNNIEDLNELLDFALQVKVDEIRNIEFQSSQKESLKREAMFQAVENAKSKGKAMAQAFDASLGKVYSINSENQSFRHRYGFNDHVETIQVTGSRIEADEFQPGRYLQENIIFSASVSVVFDLVVK